MNNLDIKEIENNISSVIKYKTNIITRIYKENQNMASFLIQGGDKNFLQNLYILGASLDYRNLLKPIIIEFVKLSLYCVESALNSKEYIDAFFECVDETHKTNCKNKSYEDKIETIYQIYLHKKNSNFFPSIFDQAIIWDNFRKKLNDFRINCIGIYFETANSYKNIIENIMLNK